MNGRTLVGTLRVGVVVGASATLTATVFAVASGQGAALWRGFGAFTATWSVFFAVFVWLVVPHQPRNAVVWLMAGSSFAGGLLLAGNAAASLLESPDLVWSTEIVAAELATPAAWIKVTVEPLFNLAMMASFTFGLLLFPDGRLASPRHRWIALLAAGGVVFSTAGSAWGYRPENTQQWDSNALFNLGILLVVPAMVVSLIALVRRFSLSNGLERDQFKWVVWGAAVFIPALVAAFAFGNTSYHDVSLGVLTAAEATFLIAYGIAVGRYDLYDVDKVISRTVVYGIVVAVLGAVYASSVFLLRTVSPWEGDLAVAASTFGAAALFNPLRRRIQRVVDRHFYRSNYDARQVVEAFSDRLRAQVHLDVLQDDLASVVTETLNPAHTAIWVRDRNGLSP